jgi:hypothetical protein
VQAAAAGKHPLHDGWAKLNGMGHALIVPATCFPLTPPEPGV